MTKKKLTNGAVPPVTEREARGAYIKMEGRRSARQLREDFLAAGRITPSIRTFEAWRGAHDWRRLAHENDEKVAAGVADKIAETATAQAITRASQFDTLATKTLQMAIDGLKEIDVASLKATDIRALAEVSERASKMHELLEGRATDRTDDLTRSKMDKLMEEMNQEIEERLKRVPTFH